MKMRNKIKLLSCNCKRCGKELLTADRSFYGLNKEKEQFGVVCSACANPKEIAEITYLTGKAIAKVF